MNDQFAIPLVAKKVKPKELIELCETESGKMLLLLDIIRQCNNLKPGQMQDLFGPVVNAFWYGGKWEIGHHLITIQRHGTEDFTNKATVWLRGAPTLYGMQAVKF